MNRLGYKGLPDENAENFILAGHPRLGYKSENEISADA